MLWAISLTCLSPAGWIQDPPRTPENIRVRTLIEALGSDRYERREDAERELMTIGRAVLLEVDRALGAEGLSPERRKSLQSLREYAANVPSVTPERLRSIKVSLDLRDGETMVGAAVKLMTRIRVPIEVLGKELAARRIKSMNLREVPLDEVLHALAAQGQARWTVHEDRKVVLYEARFADAPGLTCRLFDVATLTFRVLDFALPVPLPQPEAAGVQVNDQPLEAMPVLGGEDLVELIRASVEPKSWEEDGRDILFQNGMLVVRSTAEIHEQVAAFLKQARRQFAVQVRIEVVAIAHKPSWMERTLSKVGATLTESEFDAIRRGAAEGKEAALIGSLDLTGYKGQQVAAFSGAERAFVCGYREDGTPLKEVFAEGVLGTFRPLLSSDRLSATVRIRAAISRIVSVERVETKRGEVQVPKHFVLPIQASVAVEAGRVSILAQAGGAQGFGEGRTQVLALMRVTPIVEEGE
jgi:hypothetical protein